MLESVLILITLFIVISICTNDFFFSEDSWDNRPVDRVTSAADASTSSLLHRRLLTAGSKMLKASMVA